MGNLGRETLLTRRAFHRMLLSGCLAMGATHSCSSTSVLAGGQTPSAFSFIFANDLHITTDADVRYFSKVVDEWRSIKDPFDFVVICGDLVNNGTEQELRHVKTQLSRLAKPYYPLPGNHDLTGPDAQGHHAYRAVFGEGRENYLIQHKGFPLIFLDLTNGTSADVSVPDATMKWLRSIGRLPATLPTIVFSHFCLHPDIPRFPVANTSAVLDFFDSRRVLAFFSGHYHGRWNATRNGAAYWGNACLSNSQDNHDGTAQKGYLWVDVYETGVRVRFVEFTAANI